MCGVLILYNVLFCGDNFNSSLFKYSHHYLDYTYLQHSLPQKRNLRNVLL